MSVIFQGLSSIGDPGSRDLSIELPGPGGRSIEIDARDWLACPSLYDADTLLPLESDGLRAVDCQTALRGGVSTLNCSVDWHRIADPHERDQLVSLAASSHLPSIRLLLTASPDGDNSGFEPWFSRFAPESAGLPILKACKLYARDPAFARNLGAVWNAGWLAMVFAQDAGIVARLAASGGRLCFRHATSLDEVAAMRGPGRDIAVATSPQYLLPIASDSRHHLKVRPSPRCEDVRAPFARDVLAQVDVICTDHVAPGVTTGPGLGVQQHFLPSLLALADLEKLNPRALLGKAGSAAAAVFGADHDAGIAIVAPRGTLGTEPAAGNPERDPFPPPSFGTEVVALVTASGARTTPAFDTYIRKTGKLR